MKPVKYLRMPEIDPYRISVRIPKKHYGLKERLVKAAKTAGVDESVLILAAIKAACLFIEQHGEITLPITVSCRTIEQSIERIERFCRELSRSKAHKQHRLKKRS